MIETCIADNELEPEVAVNKKERVRKHGNKTRNVVAHHTMNRYVVHRMTATTGNEAPTFRHITFEYSALVILRKLHHHHLPRYDHRQAMKPLFGLGTYHRKSTSRIWKFAFQYEQKPSSWETSQKNLKPIRNATGSFPRQPGTAVKYHEEHCLYSYGDKCHLTYWT